MDGDVFAELCGYGGKVWPVLLVHQPALLRVGGGGVSNAIPYYSVVGHVNQVVKISTNSVNAQYSWQ